MVKITKTGNQYKINIPKEIIDLKKWDENTEILFVPFIQNAKDSLDDNTPILLKVVKVKK